MNFRDTMQDCFYRYPSLFPHPLSVAVHLFFVIGNGYEWVDGELIASKKKQPAKSFTRHKRKAHIIELSSRESGDSVYHAATMEDFKTGNFYGGQIYTQRFLPKYVYRGDAFTMVSVDTQCDGNKYLMVFDNSKQIPYEEWMG